MITKKEISNLVSAWGLRGDVIEKDYILGWLLWGIGSDPTLNTYLAFKCGTSLKKCYLDTLRFSEDLDFTVAPPGPYKPEELEPLFVHILDFLFKYKKLNIHPELIRTILAKKCRTKGVQIPTLETVQDAPTKIELISEWKNMLGHQLRDLPSFKQFWEELPNLFNWLNG